MSTNWYAIEEAITVAKIKEVNEKLNFDVMNMRQNFHPITFKHNLLSDTHWLERIDVDGTHHALEVIDFSGQNFGLMKRWGMDGENGTGEAILRPLVELGEITIVSEHDDRSPVGQAQKELYEEQQRMEKDKPLMKAVNHRLGEQTEEMASLAEPTQHGLTMRELEAKKEEATGTKKDYWRGRIDAFKGSVRYQDWMSKKTGGLIKVSA